MSTGWGRGPRGENGPQGTNKEVPGEVCQKNEGGSYTLSLPTSSPTPGRPYPTRGPIDMSCLPSKLTKLQRSPEHKAGIWTTGLNGQTTYEGFTSPAGIILTDVAINKPPDLILQSPRQVSEGSISLYSPRCIISKASSPSESSRSGSNIPKVPPRGTLLSRFYSTLRSGIFCWQSSRSLTSSSTHSRRQSLEYQKTEKQPRDNRPQIHNSVSFCDFQQSPKVVRKSSSVAQNNFLQLPDQETKPNARLRSRSLLDFQKGKEKPELLSPARYFADIEVLHNIRRREIVAKALYRESGQLFARIGRPEEASPPLPPYMLISGAAPLPPIKRDFETNPSMNYEEREKILSKIIGQKPHLESVSTEEIDPMWEKSVFAQECLRAHNLYRARHSSPPLDLSSTLCNLAQAWANHLAQTGILRHKGDPRYGENIFCRNVALAIKSQLTFPDIRGEEVAAYWYSNVRQYRFSLNDSALQAHAGSFSQMVWKSSQKFGIGKALSRSGKLIVVANYSPPGNVPNRFRYNVLPLNTRALAAEMLCHGNALLEEAMAMPDEEEISLQRALLNIGMGVSGVLAAQPPNITGRNATKILAAHMLGHAAAVVTTPDEKLDVVIVSRRSLKRKKSCKKESETAEATKLNTSPLDLLVEKLNQENSDFEHVEKALKEIINMRIKHQESLSAPNILTTTGAERRPKLSILKKVKFKSEENINYTDRSKAVQTSFSSENLSTTEDKVLDISGSRPTSSCLESEEETVSGLSDTTSSLFSNVNDMKLCTSNSTETTSTTYESQTREYITCSKSYSYRIKSDSHDAQETENTSEMCSNSQYQSTDTSLSMAPLSSGEFNTLSANPSFSSSGSDANPDSVSVQKKCNLRRVHANEKAYSSSLDSISSLPSEERTTYRSDGDGEGEEDNTRSRLQLPYDSPNDECGLLNCYALSPLHY